jgi:NAD-dependent SIR2 family protein deacetylase
MLGLRAMGRTQRIDKRFCSSCKSDKTNLIKGKYEQWYKHEGKIFCQKCHNKLYLNPKWHPITRKRIILFKGKQKYVGFNPRKGICSNCGRKSGEKYIVEDEEIIVKTGMHHFGEYHDDDPLKDTIELCQSCHMKETWILGQVKHKYAEDIMG